MKTKHIIINALLVSLFMLATTSFTSAQISGSTKSRFKGRVTNNVKKGVKKSTSGNKTENKNESQNQASTKNETASGNIIYVNIKSGKNKNDGSKANPLKNIDKAIEKCKPGDAIYVANGTYMGTFKIGYLESAKPLKLYGSWDDNFTKQDIKNHPTIFQPDNASAGKSRKALLRFTSEVAGTVINGFIWDAGERNLYHHKEGIIEGLEGGRMLLPTEPRSPEHSTVGEPLISFRSTKGGDITIENNVFVNGASFGVQAGHRSGNFKVINNVFVANKMAAIEIFGTCAGSNQQRDMVACGEVEIAYNTILFTWSRLKDMLDMGYGVRIMTKLKYNIHHNIIGTSVLGGIDNSRFCKDEYIKIDNNIMFGNKGGDLYYTPASNTQLHLNVDEFEDLEFESVNENNGQAPNIPVNKIYLKAFYNARYSEVTNYNPNSPENQWARNLGMNQQGTMSSKVTMFMNKYPWKETLNLFGASKDAGAQ